MEQTRRAIIGLTVCGLMPFPYLPAISLISSGVQNVVKVPWDPALCTRFSRVLSSLLLVSKHSKSIGGLWRSAPVASAHFPPLTRSLFYRSSQKLHILHPKKPAACTLYTLSQLQDFSTMAHR